MARSRISGIVKSKGLEARLRLLGPAIEAEIKKVMQTGAFKIRTEVIDKIRQRGGGQTVIRYGPRRVHQVSLPGEPPAGDSGQLMSGVGHRVDIDGLGAEVRIGGVSYAKDLELGTSKMSARPVMMPTFEENKTHLKRGITNAIKRGQRRVAKR